jgi:hypothetical protein
LDSNARILHTTSTTTIIDIAATEIRVGLFDIRKQKSNSAIKNVATLSRGGECDYKTLSESKSLKVGDLRPHEQCPRKTENYRHRFKTEGTVGITVEICPLPGVLPWQTRQLELSTHRTRGVIPYFGHVATK